MSGITVIFSQKKKIVQDIKSKFFYQLEGNQASTDILYENSILTPLKK